LFLHWICETYIAKKRKRGKRKSINQYCRDFKMLYRRINGKFVDVNDSDEVVKVCCCSPRYVPPELTLTYSTTFLFRENALPILCPISHILTRAIRDDAILVDGYTSAKPFFTTNLRGQGMKAMKVHWKPEWLKRPVFRRPVRPMAAWEKSKTEPLPYSAYAFYINRLGRNTGFEDELTSYCFRRGTANAIDGKPRAQY